MIVEIIEYANYVSLEVRGVTLISVNENNIPSGINESVFTQKGEIIVGTGDGIYVILPPGNKNETIIYDPDEPAGLKTGVFQDATGWKNVKNAGAAGNGTTDDTVVVQALIDSSSDGDVVYFPPGSYLLGTINLKPGVAIIGGGSRATKLIAQTNNTKIFNYTASSTQFHFIIRGFSLSSNSKTGCYGIYLDGVDTSKRISYIRIEDLHIIGTFSRAIYLQYCANTFINRVFITQSAIGISIDKCADTDVVSCMVQSGSSYGYFVKGVAGAWDEGVRLISCSTNGQAIGLRVEDQDWGIASGCSFTTCSGGACWMVNSDNWHFAGCDFAVAGTPANPGCDVDANCQSILFSCCHFAINTFGLNLRGTRHSVRGCTFESGTNVDVYLNAATKCSVGGNVCDSTGVAWSILEGGAANYNSVTGNVSNGTVSLVGGSSVSVGNVVY